MTMPGAATRILVVDDDSDIVAVASLVLRRAGHEVDTAGSGAEALKRALQKTYDLVLLDINMPGLDGWETLRLLRSDEATRGTAVAMFSVKSEVRDKVHGLQDGAVDYITKPFSVDELAARVAAILRRRQAPMGRAEAR
jgi:DNA-binding response OmpR family regulator